LALVAQQAALHGGRAELTGSPLGGLRAVLDLPLALPAHPGG
jgi:two-component system sensor histidine kinase PrrB